MKRILLVLLVLVTSITAFAQKTVDFTTYDVVAKAGDVTIIMKDNDYRMIIGSVKKPKLNMVMGYTKEQAASKIDRILEFSNESYTKKDRNGNWISDGLCYYLGCYPRNFQSVP